MPGNTIAEDVRHFFELENLSEDHLCLVGNGGRWSVINRISWIGDEWLNGMPLNSSQNNNKIKYCAPVIDCIFSNSV